MSSSQLSKASCQSSVWSNSDNPFFNELDQVVHTERDKDQRTEEKVVQKDEAKIVQNQIGEARKFIIIHISFDAFKQRERNFWPTTRRPSRVVCAVVHLIQDSMFDIAHRSVQEMRQWMVSNVS